MYLPGHDDTYWLMELASNTRPETTDATRSDDLSFWVGLLMELGSILVCGLIGFFVICIVLAVFA